jgi:hypothetical protein
MTWSSTLASGSGSPFQAANPSMAAWRASTGIASPGVDRRRLQAVPEWRGSAGRVCCRSFEDALRNHTVDSFGAIHDLCHIEVHGHTGEHVGILAGEMLFLTYLSAHDNVSNEMGCLHWQTVRVLRKVNVNGMRRPRCRIGGGPRSRKASRLFEGPSGPDHRSGSLYARDFGIIFDSWSVLWWWLAASIRGGHASSKASPPGAATSPYSQ